MSFILFHGDKIMAHSKSLVWIKESAMPFHYSAHASNVFVLPVKGN